MKLSQVQHTYMYIHTDINTTVLEVEALHNYNLLYAGIQNGFHDKSSASI